MNGSPKHVRAFLFGIVAIAVIGICCAIVIWNKQDSSPQIASEEIVADFFSSMAALDVEENDRAVATLTNTIKVAPEEPALFANLALGQLRLGEKEAATTNITAARKLPHSDSDVDVIYAEVLKQTGNLESAVEQLKEVHERNPDNVRVTHSIVQMLDSLQLQDSNSQCLQYVKKILQVLPDNIQALCEQGRYAAALKDEAILVDTFSRLRAMSSQWPEGTVRQLAQGEESLQKKDFQQVAINLTYFENLMITVPSFLKSRQQLEGESTAIGSPIRRLLQLNIPPIDIEKADTKLTFEDQALKQWNFKDESSVPQLVVAFSQVGEGRQNLLWSISQGQMNSSGGAQFPFPGATNVLKRDCIQMVDLNWDLRQDLVVVGEQGCKIFLQQSDDSFQPFASETAEFSLPCRAVWPIDIDADGDIDLLTSDYQSSLKCFINDGEARFKPLAPFIATAAILQMQFLDADVDGDVDLLMLNAQGEIICGINNRGLQFSLSNIATDAPCRAIAAGCITNNDRIELLALLDSGAIQSINLAEDGKWQSTRLLAWDSFKSLQPEQRNDCILSIADLDNSGACDVIACTAGQSQIWLADVAAAWSVPASVPQLRVNSILDIDQDGLLDLIGENAKAGQVAINKSQAGYHWQEIETRANPNAGDKRINSVGLGGRIELRSGYRLQTQGIQSSRTHFGLGNHSGSDVARIVWPNGTTQSEFKLADRQEIVAAQRLKGSCPWVFAYNGHEFQFVKDFIWRSPLGLRINAQATAGTTQTEDWIRISGDQLKVSEGHYKLRISAELWETHFFDHIGLVAVDHPIDTHFYIDERFNPRQRQSQHIYLLTAPSAVTNVSDDRGVKLDAVVEKVDGNFVDTFALGPFQGTAAEHFIQFELPDSADLSREIALVANGWVYPTDSSLNVAISQRNDTTLNGLVLEQLSDQGNWQVVVDDLGFPAGKAKDIIITLPQDKILPKRPLRLRTNMEIYWDQIAWAYVVNDATAEVKQTELATAELRYRGYSKLQRTGRRRPDVPYYQVESTAKRWLDLEGYYTRFGPVEELLEAVEDRYVIMNAGDEICLEFQSLNPPADHVRRDFILIGDGWVKDGDFNTAFSQTVLPLPSHQDTDYAGPLLPLQEDPIYLKHRSDWDKFHTRHVTPQPLLRCLASPLQESHGMEKN